MANGLDKVRDDAKQMVKVNQSGKDSPPERLKTDLAEAEISRRKDVAAKAFRGLEALETAIKGVKPKTVGVAEDGTERKEFIPQDYQKKKKLEEKFARLDAAFSKVLPPTATEQDYEALEKAIEKNKP